MLGNLLILLPILFPLIAGVVLLATNMNESQRKTFVGAVVVINFLLVLLAIFNVDQTVTLVSVTEALSIKLMADGLSKFFLILVSIIWLLVTLYAFEYMTHEENENRFFAFYLMTLGTLMGIGLSRNLLTFYLFYEMMTFITYPLVTHNGSQEAIAAGTKYIIYSLIGAQFSLITMMSIFYFGNTLDFTAGGVLDPSVVSGNENLVLLLFVLTVVGFGAKAGLFPLHAWLPIAHPVAPAPASGILSGIITKAGVLGVIRMTYFIFGVDFLRGTWAQYATMILAIITIFLGSMLAYNAKVMKVRLAYSSVSQVSYVLLGVLTMNAIGLTGGLLHMVFHAVVKNVLFLSVGAIIFKTRNTTVDEIRGIGKSMPIVMWTFTLGSLALIGIPPFSGFISKWFLGTGSLNISITTIGLVAIVILIISAILTAGYLLSITAKAFFPGKDFDYSGVVSLEPSYYMLLPLVVLAAASLLLGMIPNPLINYITNIITPLF